MNTLCKCLNQFYSKTVTLMDWTPVLIELFDELKKGVKHSPVLAIFHSNKQTYPNTYWIMEGMGCILIRPTDDEESQQSVKRLRETG